MGEDSRINVHSIIPRSEINGPGSRMVVFFQGCGARCPGCFNPGTHDFRESTLYTPREIFETYYEAGIEGITVSGGEPLLQGEPLYQLLKLARKEYGLTTVVYTGFTCEELSCIEGVDELFKYIDVLVDGRYDRKRKEPSLLARGSTNQTFHFFSERYRQDDFIIAGKVEVIIGRDGKVVQTGFSKIA